MISWVKAFMINSEQAEEVWRVGAEAEHRHICFMMT